ncbi:PREDICTED: RNA polymerase II-associated protein 1-like [Nicrophorus vespilloides]|uniref:RNA polymerase II-associated protein 1-like n=1 Tax=Nicrophorus vespilloides TaxID=110193 RepID=A0ABM1MDW6_NICVS|nr:PREDICTED: RNA polymerase II-associated protein 1-like [Nicrophorus vespilloides]
MYQTLKPSKSEENLLKLQEEFNKDKAAKKIKVAATVVSGYEKSERMEVESPGESAEEIPERLGDAFTDIPKNFKVGPIIERTSFKVPRSGCNFKFSQATGFPIAKRRDTTLSTGEGSIFRQQMNKLKEMKCADNDQKKRNIEINQPGSSKVINKVDKKQIDQENMDLMSQMTEEEILAEREKLMSTLDPAILAFMKSKRFHRKETVETRQPSIAKQNKPVEGLSFEDLQSAMEILDQPESDKWLNFDVLETNKLAWIQNVDVPKITKDSLYEARFDFNGWLLPFTNDGMTESNRSLYHHGEEPGRPGYTLQELFQLSRSNVNQQKIVALNTIANILVLQSSGIYDEVIEIPIEQIFFVLRFSLDDNTPAILNASIKAMRSLIYHPIDETCLDNLWSFGLGLIQPILAIDNEEKLDDKTVNDQQLVETNLIKCLTRTDIVIRIRYILITVKPCLETVSYLMEILTRLARDSNFVMMQVYECHGLLQSVITNFAPDITNLKNLTNSYGQPLTQALKFLRVLSAGSRKIAIQLIDKYKILDSIMSYLSNESISANVNGMKLQIEAFRLWSSLARYGLTLDRFKDFQHVLYKLLDYHLKNSDHTSSYTVQAHVSSLLILISEVAKHDFDATKVYYQLLLDLGVTKWLTQFTTMQQFTCGKLQIVSSFLVAMTNFVMSNKPSSVDMSVDVLINFAEKMMDSHGFNLVTKDIQSASNVLNNYETHKCGANFKYTEAAVWNCSDHVVPVFKPNSCIPFIRVFSDFVESTKNKKLMIKFLSNDNVLLYLRQVKQANKYYLTGNWYTRVESGLLLSILKMAIEVQNSIDTGFFYALAMKTLSIYHEDQKPDVEYVLKHAIFSPEFYPPDVFLARMDIEDAEDPSKETLKSALDNINDIFNVYMNVLGLKKLKVNPLWQSVDVNMENALPIDWIYSPIIILYSNQQEEQNTITKDDQVFIITNCLRWVYIYETYFPSLAIMIDTTDRFCRLACTFLGSDSLFLIPDVKNLLELCLKSVLKIGDQLNFERNIHGLCNFQDFFTQLLEQYLGVSYGDALFGNFVLIPLAQKHNVKYRKTVWSEYAGIVQVFNLTEKDIVLSIESFLEPEETDMSLLRCYAQALRTHNIRTHSVFYKIAKHHVQKFHARRNMLNESTFEMENKNIVQ